MACDQFDEVRGWREREQRWSFVANDNIGDCGLSQQTPVGQGLNTWPSAWRTRWWGTPEIVEMWFGVDGRWWGWWWSQEAGQTEEWLGYRSRGDGPGTRLLKTCDSPKTASYKPPRHCLQPHFRFEWKGTDRVRVEQREVLQRRTNKRHTKAREVEMMTTVENSLRLAIGRSTVSSRHSKY